MLGHSSVSIKLDIYSHVIPGLGDAAATRWRTRWTTIPA
jgi:hypothetical protein